MNLDPKKLLAVAQYELAEAAASRMLVFILVLYAAGSALVCALFLKGFQAAEGAAREGLANQMQIPVEAVPENLVREKALPALISMVGNADLRDALLDMPILAIFYMLVALGSVALLVLATSAGTHAADLQSGSARFPLVRIDRVTWAVGKYMGQAALLFIGLLGSALAAAGVGVWLEPTFDSAALVWLFRASGAAWLYGVAFLGIYSGASLTTRAPMKARFLSLLLLVLFTVAHGVTSSEWLVHDYPGVDKLQYIFPAAYKDGLWLDSIEKVGLSAAALLVISAIGLASGLAIFSRRDA